MVNVRKRGNVYEYNFDVVKIEGKRKRISKSGFKTKAEALKQGTIAWRISQGWSVEKALTQKAVNRKRIGKRYIEYKGEIKTMAEWAKEIQMPYKILCSRSI